MKRYKYIFSAVCILIAFSIVFLVRTDVEGAVPNPLLYYDDSKWGHEDKLPIEKVLGIYYIPASVFANIDGYEIRVNQKQKTFIIEYANGEKFLSFDTSSGFALDQDGQQIYIPTYEFHDERYVPAQELCKRLGLRFETLTSPVTGEVALRIRSSKAKETFVLLIYSNYPGFYTPETTEPVTTAGTTDTTATTESTDTIEPTPELTNRIIYLTIEDSPGEYTEDILDLLDKYDCKATFFLIGDNVKDSPEILSKIVSRGHAIGLHTMDHSNPSEENILSDIESENDLLYGYVRQKSLIWRAPEGSKNSHITRKTENILNNAGYIIWDWDVEPVGRTLEAKTESVIDGIWENETAVIRIKEDEYSVKILKSVLEFISANRDVCDVRTITPAEYEINNVNAK